MAVQAARRRAMVAEKEPGPEIEIFMRPLSRQDQNPAEFGAIPHITERNPRPIRLALLL
jgi:hypothetical protein